MLAILVNFCACQKKIFLLHGLHVANISGGEGPNPPSRSSQRVQADPTHRLWSSPRQGLESDDGGISVGLRPKGQSQHLGWKSLPSHLHTERSTQAQPSAPLVQSSHSSFLHQWRLVPVSPGDFALHLILHSISTITAGSGTATYGWWPKPFKPLPQCRSVPRLNASPVNVQWKETVFLAPASVLTAFAVFTLSVWQDNTALLHGRLLFLGQVT